MKRTSTPIHQMPLTEVKTYPLTEAEKREVVPLLQRANMVRIAIARLGQLVAERLGVEAVELDPNSLEWKEIKK